MARARGAGRRRRKEIALAGGGRNSHDTWGWRMCCCLARWGFGGVDEWIRLAAGGGEDKGKGKGKIK
jgi:hypothetical protein